MKVNFFKDELVIHCHHRFSHWILCFSQEPPFVEKVNESTPLPDGIIPKNQLQGFCIDLIEEISKKANFDYEIYLDNSYKGMVDALKSQVAIFSLTIEANRELHQFCLALRCDKNTIGRDSPQPPSKLGQIFNWVIRDCLVFALLRSVIGPENLHHS